MRRTLLSNESPLGSLSNRVNILVLWLVCLMGSGLASCASSATISPALPSGVSVNKALADGQKDLEEGDWEAALIRVAAILAERDLTLEQRDKAEQLGQATLEGLTGAQKQEQGQAQDRSQRPDRLSAEDLEQLARLDLPIRLRSKIAVLAGRAHLNEGSRVLAYKYLRDFEEQHPKHPEREAAGDIVAEAGFSLIEDPGRYGLLLRYRSKGLGALEFLVLRFPFNKRCDEAYAALAQTYESRGDLDRAIARLEDLLLYHPNSPLAPVAEAHLPRLRMQRVARDDYDRSELERARTEFDTWLSSFEDQKGVPKELIDEVRADRAKCLVRLANNDLIVARYHRRIKQSFGTRQHAQRAISLAELAGGQAQDLEQEARDLIAWADKKDGLEPERNRESGAPAEASPGASGGAPLGASAPPQGVESGE